MKLTSTQVPNHTTLDSSDWRLNQRLNFLSEDAWDLAMCPDISSEIQKISEGNIGMNTPRVYRNGVPARGVADPIGYMRMLTTSPAAQDRADKLVERITNTVKECLEQGDT